MEVTEIRNIAFPVDDELHREIKIQATREGITTKDYIIALVKKDLENKKQRIPHCLANVTGNSMADRSLYLKFILFRSEDLCQTKIIDGGF